MQFVSNFTRRLCLVFVIFAGIMALPRYILAQPAGTDWQELNLVPGIVPGAERDWIVFMANSPSLAHPVGHVFVVWAYEDPTTQTSGIATAWGFYPENDGRAGALRIITGISVPGTLRDELANTLEGGAGTGTASETFAVEVDSETWGFYGMVQDGFEMDHPSYNLYFSNCVSFADYVARL